MTKGPKIFKISCWDLNRRIEGLMTDSQNRVVLERDVLPIIFVPGIMGSRLGRSQQIRVWDPDDKWFMFTHYGRRKADAALKKSLLVGNRFDEDYLQVLNEDAKGHSQIYSLNDKKRKNRQWGGVCWSSYGSFLEQLQNRKWDRVVNLFYEFPVHCFGYNWTASNRRSGTQLAAYVEEVIQSYTNQNRKCEKVILVTHSMGGLVARAACKFDGAEANVLATIHGVLPTNGSPAAFWRMKGGFERPHNIPDLEPMQWFRNPVKASSYAAKKALTEVTGYITSWVLGTDGEEVTALLGNMPGGLQLLPNRYYKNNCGSERWLEVVDAAGKQMTLPVTDPYEEIYRKKGVYYRLVKPEWLNPGVRTEMVDEFEDSDWFYYLDYLSEAEKFHDDLYDKSQIEPYNHPETYQFYSTGIASADRVVFTRSEDSLWQSAKRILSSITEDIPTDIDGVGKALIFTVAGIGMPLAKKLVEVAFDLAGGAILRDSDWSANRGGYRDRVDEADAPDKKGLNLVMMQLPSGSGDGTVPDSSARALKFRDDTKRTFSIGDDPGFVANGNGKGGDQPDFYEAYFNRAHEPVFGAPSAQFITIAAIENICRKEIKKRLGVDNELGVVPL